MVRSALVGDAPVQPGPSAVAVNEATNTIYVANGNNANGPNAGGNTVSVIDGRRCRSADVSRCRGPWPTVTVGELPSSIAVDQATDTVFVTNWADNTVSVFDGAVCNARVTSGCGQTPATVPVGSAPFGVFADAANHTVYVGNPGPDFDQNTISMIDTVSCNGTHLAGCAGQVPATATVGPGPAAFDVNDRTHTVYVAQVDGVGVSDADTCNAAVGVGVAAVRGDDRDGVVDLVRRVQGVRDRVDGDGLGVAAGVDGGRVEGRAGGLVGSVADAHINDRQGVVLLVISKDSAGLTKTVPGDWPAQPVRSPAWQVLPSRTEMVLSKLAAYTLLVSGSTFTTLTAAGPAGSVPTDLQPD